MILIPGEAESTALDAEADLHDLRDDLPRLGRARDEPSWQLALYGLADEVEDVIVVVSRLASHEREWGDTVAPAATDGEAPLDAYLRRMRLMTGARSDVRSLFLLLDVLLDSAAKALRTVGAPPRPTESLAAFVDHLENKRADWSDRYVPLAGTLAALQYSLGYFRDKFIAHRDVQPVGAVYLPDGRVRLRLLAGTFSDDQLARGGRENARVLSDRLAIDVPDAPLDQVYDDRLDIAFSLLPSASPEHRAQLTPILREFGVTSPDPYAIAVRAASGVQFLLSVAAHLGPRS